MPVATIGRVNRKRQRLVLDLRVTLQKIITSSNKPKIVARSIATAAEELPIAPRASSCPTSTEDEAALARDPTTITAKKPNEPKMILASPLKTVRNRKSSPKLMTERNDRDERSNCFCVPPEDCPIIPSVFNASLDCFSSEVCVENCRTASSDL